MTKNDKDKPPKKVSHTLGIRSFGEDAEPTQESEAPPSDTFSLPVVGEGFSLESFDQMLNQKISESQLQHPLHDDQFGVQMRNQTPSSDGPTLPFANPESMSVDDFDAYILEKLEIGGGVLEIGESESLAPSYKGLDTPLSSSFNEPTDSMFDPFAEEGDTQIPLSPNMNFDPFAEEGETQIPLTPKTTFDPHYSDPFEPKGLYVEPTAERPSVESKSPYIEPTAERPSLLSIGEQTNADRRFESLVLGPNAPLPSGDALLASDIPGFEDESEPTDPMLGVVIAGRFEIQGLLGRGGMGKVYRAKQVGLGREVALKLLHPHLAAEPEARARFHREAQSMSRLNHPGITAIYDFGEWEGQFFISMELLDGVSLNKNISPQKPLELDVILPIMQQACDALSVAHEAGLVHRDLKPENIVLLSDGTVKLVDFGLAILKDISEEERLTVEGMTIGTPHYMSPEQCQGMEVDHRSDIYALGCILYEMLTGEIPFVGESLMAIMMQQLFAEPIPPTHRKGGVNTPPYLEELVMEALSKNPEERPASVADFSAALTPEEGAHADSKRGGASAHFASRDVRASAVGIPHLSGRIVRSPTKFADVLFLVLEQPEHYSESFTMHMWSNGFTVKQLTTFEEAVQEVQQLHPAALVVDLRPDPEGLFGRLEEALSIQALGDCAAVVIGPDDAFEQMTRALEIGVFDYVADTSARKKLPKSLRRIARKKARLKKKPSA